ncbi:MAG: protein-disulfide reductase DsbD family protein [Burkholderiales bacterium]
MVVALAVLAGLVANPAIATSVRSTAAEAELVSAHAAIVPGRSLDLGLRIKLDPDWHVYWKNAGDSGSPPALALTLPDGFRAGPLQFAAPLRIPVAHLVNYGFEGEVLFPVTIEVPAGLASGRAITLRARADWLECKESCLPATADLSLTLPVATHDRGTTVWTALFEATRPKLPVVLPNTVVTSATSSAGSLSLSVEGLANCTQADFFPDREGLFVHAKITRVAGSIERLRFMLPLESNAIAPDTLSGVVTCTPAGATTRAYDIATPVARARGTPSADASGEALSFGLALFFAFLGGLALNLMPCVFPVLGLKVLGLAQHPVGAQRALSARIGHASWFLAGVLASFAALASAMLILRAAGEHVGWGFQLQSPVFVSAMAVLFFLLALNLSGFFEWGFGIQSAAGTAAARWSGPFFDGVLAVLIASPCTAPFMGAAIGFTLAQPAPLVLGVFGALAIGMATPYVVLAINPALLGWLPKSGPWLESLKQFLAFPLYATVLWLAWVLGEIAGLDASIRLGVLLLTATFAIWLWRRRVARAVAMITALALVAGAAAWLNTGLAARPTSTPVENIWKPWSAQVVANLLAQGTPVFIDFTAAWCVTCQVNKHAVLHTDTITRALRETGTVALRADWTRQDPEITKALAALARSGVPVYVLYDRAGQVQLLPEILTTSRVLDALGARRTSAQLAGDAQR